MPQNDKIGLVKRFLRTYDVDDYKLLHNLYYKSLCYFALGFVHDHHTSEDLVQDAFVSLWEKRKELDADTNLTAYLYASVKNNCLIFLRKKKIHHRFVEHTFTTSINDWEEDISLNIIKSEVYREIMDKINELPPRMKEVFMLCYVYKLKDKEIAEQLAISINSIKTHKKRAKSILRQELIDVFRNLIIIFI